MKLKDTFSFSVPVENVEQRFTKQWVSGSGDKAQFREVSAGWYLTLAGSHEAQYVGNIKPNAAKGDIASVRISIHAKD